MPSELCKEHSGCLADIAHLKLENAVQWKEMKDLKTHVDSILSRMNVILGGIIVAVVLLLINIGIARGATQTINTVPSANATFMADLQTFLQDENAERSPRYTRVVSGGIGATDASLTHTISAVTAYVEGYYVYDAAVSHTYTASTDTFVLLRYDDAATIAIAGAAITYDGNFVFAECANGTAQPDAPAGTMMLFEAVTSGVAITTVNDYRTGGIAFLSDPRFADGASGRLKDAVDTLSSLPVDLVIDADDNIAADTTVPTTMKLYFPKGNILTVASTKTLTIYSPANIIAAPSQQIFTGTGAVEFSSSDGDGIHFGWFGFSSSETAANNVTYGQKAIDALPSTGGSLRMDTLPLGTYQINNYLEITTSNTELVGRAGITLQGTAATYLLYAHGTDAATRINGVRLTGNGMVLDGNSTASVGIVAQYLDDSLIEGWQTDDFTVDGISVDGSGGGVYGYRNKVIRCSGSGNGTFGIIVAGYTDVEVAHNNYRTSGNSDYDIKNCFNFNVHDNESSTSTQYGINVRCSSHGTDVTGRIVNNKVQDATRGSFYIHNDDGDASTGSMYDIVVANNISVNPGWSDYTIASITGEPITNLTFTGNMGRSAGTHSFSIDYASLVTVSGNILDDPDDRCLLLKGVQYGSFTGNVLRNPGKSGTTRPVVEIADGDDTTTYCLYNIFTGNLLVKGDYGTFGFNELSTANSDYNRFEGNNFQGFTNVYDKHVVYGVNSEVSMPIWYSSTTEVSTSGTGEDDLMTIDVGLLGPKGIVEIKASGIITDVSAGDKTIKLHIGTNETVLQAAANTNNDWVFEGIIMMTATDSFNLSYKGLDYPNGDWKVIALNIGGSSRTVKFTGECSNANDSITQKTMMVRRVK